MRMSGLAQTQMQLHVGKKVALFGLKTTKFYDE